MGKYVDKRLEEFGGTRVYELGLGDDDGNIEGSDIGFPKVGKVRNYCERRKPFT
jgi:hypothetical protein